MPKEAASVGVLCDTGFLIRLNQPEDPLHANARSYLKYCLENQFPMFVSMIALAEYAVRDRIGNLPMRYFRVIPFNIDHAQVAGEFAAVAFHRRQQMPQEITQRTIITNDTKMFAQADVTPSVTHYLTADEQYAALFRTISTQVQPRFQLLSLRTSPRSAFGELDFGD